MGCSPFILLRAWWRTKRGPVTDGGEVQERLKTLQQAGKGLAKRTEFSTCGKVPTLKL
jgi:hypothetical protein